MFVLTQKFHGLDLLQVILLWLFKFEGAIYNILHHTYGTVLS